MYCEVHNKNLLVPNEVQYQNIYVIHTMYSNLGELNLCIDEDANYLSLV